MLQDLLVSARALRRQPALAALAVITLALGIGAASAIFTVVDAVVLRPFPFTDQGRLVTVWKEDPRRQMAFVEVSFPDFADLRASTRTLSGLAAMSSVNLGFALSGDEGPVQVKGQLVSADFFDVLGVAPALGHGFPARADEPGAAPVVVLGHALWQQRYGGDPAAIGRAVRIDDTIATIAGVMPAGFSYPEGAELWAPVVSAIPDIVNERRVQWMVLAGRLAPGASIESAKKELDAAIAGLNARFREGAEQRAVVKPLVAGILGDTRQAMLLMLAGVCALLLIACANVAALLMVRASARQRADAIRLALGASRARVARLFVAEAALLSIAGCAAGLVLSLWTTALLVSIAPADLPRIAEAAPDVRALAFTLLVSAATAILCGLVPAFTVREARLEQLLRSGRSGGAVSLTGRHALVVLQVGAALVLLVGAGLMARSFVRLRTVDLGFDPRNLLTFELPLRSSAYPTPDHRRAFYDALLERLEGSPGVVAAAGVIRRPLAGPVGWDWTFEVEGQPPDESRRNPVVNFEAVSHEYFRTMAIPLLAGRLFTRADTWTSAGVVVVSESIASRHWGSPVAAVGRRVRFSMPETPFHQAWLTVVGVVADARYREMTTTRGDLYMTYQQCTIPLNHFVIRTSGDPLALAPALRSYIAALDRDQAIDDLTTMEAIVGRELGDSRFTAQVLALFAALALLLASVGLYGVLAQAVGARTREIGIRMALGASAKGVLRLVVGQGLRLTLIGLAIGTLAALVASRLLERLLFGVAPTDATTYAGVWILLGAVGVLASYLPARRAAAVDPLIALRED
jgi:putative ABC transport system permease protein